MTAAALPPDDSAPATRGDLRDLENALKGDMRNLETALKGDVRNLETALKGDMRELRAELRLEMKEMEGRLESRMATHDDLNILRAEMKSTGENSDKRVAAVITNIRWIAGIFAAIFVAVIVRMS